MVDGFYSMTLTALALVSLGVIIAALRQRKRKVRVANDGELPPRDMRIAVVASTSRRARQWAMQQGIGRDRYYFVDSVDDLQQEPCFYVPVDGYDQRPDWPALYAELDARGYERWWPPMNDTDVGKTT